MNVLGMDPGLSGSMALLDRDGQCLELVDMPTYRVVHTRRELEVADVVGLLEDWRVEHGEFRVMLEHAQPRPKEGAASGFKTGRNFGVLIGILAAQKISHELVSPQKWQRAVHGKVAAGTGKARSRELARRLYPTVDLGKRKSEDRSDALMLAVYALRLWSGRDETD